MNKPVVAIIPAKGYSRRVPNKNMRPFNGKPLVFHTIEQALKSQFIDEVYVSTDKPEIKAYCESCGARVPFLRPTELSRDDVHGSVPILHMLEKLGGANKYSYCVQLLPSNPLKTARTNDEVVRLSKERQTNVLSVTPFGKTMFHLRTISAAGVLERVTREVVYNVQTQDMTELYYLNGAVYSAPVEELLLHRTYHYGTPLGYAMDPIEAFDIDTETDFIVAETLGNLIKQDLLRGL